MNCTQLYTGATQTAGQTALQTLMSVSLNLKSEVKKKKNLNGGLGLPRNNPLTNFDIT
jgi:hypothetical protein